MGCGGTESHTALPANITAWNNNSPIFLSLVSRPVVISINSLRSNNGINGCTNLKCALSSSFRRFSSGSCSAPFFARNSRSSIGIREGVGLIKYGSPKARDLCGIWGKDDAVDGGSDDEYASDGTEALEVA